MSSNQLKLEFHPAVNQPSFGRLSLKIDPEKIDTVQKLRQKVAFKLNYFPQCILFVFAGQFMEDRRKLQQFKFKNGDQIFIIITQKDMKAPDNVQPLVVGGIDLTDISQFSGLLKKKNNGMEQNNLPNIAVGGGGGEARPKAEQGVDNNLKEFFKDQLVQIKEIVGNEKTESQILAAIQRAGGLVQQALQILFS